MTLLEGQWLLEYPGAAQAIGGRDPIGNPFGRPMGIFHTAAPVIGEVSATTEDEQRARMDGVAFGQDFHGNRTITFELGVKARTEAAALELYSNLARAWRADAIRKTPGAMATLKTRNGGRDRMVWGRPRRIVPIDTWRKQGWIGVQCDFATSDGNFYAHDPLGTAIPFVPPPAGGFPVPAAAPWASTASTATSGTILVEGELPVDPILSVAGPIMNPIIEVANVWRLELALTLQAGQVVTIDTRPATRSVVRQDGASFRGALTKSSRLDRAQLAPGPYVISLQGTDSTGLSSLGIQWFNTYVSI